MPKAPKPPVISTYTATTQVLLTDGATLEISVAIATPSPTKFTEAYTRGSIHSWFNGGSGGEVSLRTWKFDSDRERDFLATISANHGSPTSSAAVTACKVISPPIEGFETKSFRVSARLTTGEVVEVEIAVPYGRGLPPPTNYHASVAFAKLTTLGNIDLPNIVIKLNEALKISGQSWDYRVIGLRLL